MTSRQVEERFKSDRVRGFEEEAAEVVATRSFFRVSRIAGSDLRMFLKGRSDSSSELERRRFCFCFCFLSAIGGNDTE